MHPCVILLFVASAAAQPSAKAPADAPGGPPVVSAKAWAVADGQTGRVLWAGGEETARPMASTTKVMTGWLVTRLAADDPAVFDQVVTVSERAAKTPGSGAKLVAGDRLPVRDLLFGLLLPSGNDAAVAVAEHFGPRFGTAGDPVERFVGEMNRQAKAIGLTATRFADPNGLSRENVTTARELAALTWHAMRDDRFRGYVATRQHECMVKTADGGTRAAVWANTNRLLDIDGYDGVKTGTTTPAGQCLTARGRRGDRTLIVVVLGSASGDGRYVDARNLFRWGWAELERPAGR